MTTTPTPRARVADHAERERALDTGSSFLVQAPAGSGKTELLIRRFLALLAVASRPEAIVAITFTRKAAAEMKTRILAALREAATAEAPPNDPLARGRYELARRALERSRRQGWRLVDNPGRIEVSTIDSLCSRLAAAMPLLSSFGRTPQLCEQPEPLYREAVRRTLARAGEPGERGAAVRNLAARREMRVGQVEEQMTGMLGRRDQWAHGALAAVGAGAATGLVEAVEEGFRRAVAQHLAELAEALGKEQREAVEKTAQLTRANLEQDGKDCAWPTLGDTSELGGGVECLDAWREAAELLLIKNGSLRKRLGKSVGASRGSDAARVFEELRDEIEARPGEEFRRVLRLLDEGRRLPASPAFTETGREALLALFRVLLHAHAELWEVFRRAGEADFVEVAARSLAALGSAKAPSELLERLDRRIEHLLVDEFQDTSLMQCELLRRLTAGWEPGDGRTLFLVGDPMQSIYRFRKAEVGLYLQARSAAGLFDNIPLELVRLRVNFRSQEKIIAWVNETFSRVMGARDDPVSARIAYAASLPAPGAPSLGEVECLVWEEAEGRRGSEEARGLAELIGDDLLPQARSRGGSVAVLVRTRKQGASLVEELRAAGVAYRAEGLETFAERPIIADLRSLASAIEHRGDRLSILALLRSPLVGVSLEDIARLVEPDVAACRERAGDSCRSAEELGEGRLASVGELMTDPKALARVSEDGRVRIERLADALGRARRELGCRRLADIVEGTWIELGGPQLCRPWDLGDAERFFGLLDTLETGGLVDPCELERRLETLEAGASADPSIAVEIMTMHKAKGLEFDTVVLPRLEAIVARQDRPPLLIETDPRSGELAMVAVAAERGGTSEDDAKYDLLRMREAARQRSETCRLLYVAATRARRCLVLSASARFNKDGSPRKGSLLAELWPALERDISACIPCRARASAGESGEQELRITRYWAGPSLPPPAPVALVVSRRPSDSDDQTPVEPGTAGRLPACVGTVTHEWLARIAGEGIDAWPSERVACERKAVRRALARRGVLGMEIEAAARNVEHVLIGTLADERGRWILGPHEQARCEWKLSWFGEGTRMDAIIDRTFVAADGVRWIIDYKTGRPDPDEGRYAGLDGEAAAEAAAERFVEEHLERYRGQLERYGRLLHTLEPERPIRLALYFPHLKRWRPWDYDPAG